MGTRTEYNLRFVGPFSLEQIVPSPSVRPWCTFNLKSQGSWWWWPEVQSAPPPPKYFPSPSAFTPKSGLDCRAAGSIPVIGSKFAFSQLLPFRSTKNYRHSVTHILYLTIYSRSIIPYSKQFQELLVSLCCLNNDPYISLSRYQVFCIRPTKTEPLLRQTVMSDLREVIPYSV